MKVLIISPQVIFYKYNFNRNPVLGEKATGIVRIVLHTLANHAHECDRYRAEQGTSFHAGGALGGGGGGEDWR